MSEMIIKWKQIRDDWKNQIEIVKSENLEMLRKWQSAYDLFLGGDYFNAALVFELIEVTSRAVPPGVILNKIICLHACGINMPILIESQMLQSDFGPIILFALGVYLEKTDPEESLNFFKKCLSIYKDSIQIEFLNNYAKSCWSLQKFIVYLNLAIMSNIVEDKILANLYLIKAEKAADNEQSLSLVHKYKKIGLNGVPCIGIPKNICIPPPNLADLQIEESSEVDNEFQKRCQSLDANEPEDEEDNDSQKICQQGNDPEEKEVNDSQEEEVKDSQEICLDVNEPEDEEVNDSQKIFQQGNDPEEKEVNDSQEKEVKDSQEICLDVNGAKEVCQEESNEEEEDYEAWTPAESLTFWQEGNDSVEVCEEDTVSQPKDSDENTVCETKSKTFPQPKVYTEGHRRSSYSAEMEEIDKSEISKQISESKLKVNLETSLPKTSDSHPLSPPITPYVHEKEQHGLHYSNAWNTVNGADPTNLIKQDATTMNRMKQIYKSKNVNENIQSMLPSTKSSLAVQFKFTASARVRKNYGEWQICTAKLDSKVLKLFDAKDSSLKIWELNLTEPCKVEPETEMSFRGMILFRITCGEDFFIFCLSDLKTCLEWITKIIKMHKDIPAAYRRVKILNTGLGLDRISEESHWKKSFW